MQAGDDRAARSWVLTAALLAALFLAGLACAPLLDAAGIRGAGFVRAACYPLCHQLPARSVSLAGYGFPVCARCLGLYVGGCAGLFLAWLVPALGRRAQGPWLMVALLPTVLDALAHLAGWPGAANLPRLALAIPAGTVAGLLLAEGIADLQALGPGRAWCMAAGRHPAAVAERE